MRHYEMDDLRTTVSLSNVVIANGVSLPAPGNTIVYTGLEQCGIEFDADHRGYAIIHTARPMRRPAKPVELTVTEIKATNLLGWRGLEVTAKYTLPTQGYIVK